MDSKIEGLYALRNAKLEDYAFIKATWLRGLYYGESWYSMIPKDIFMKNNSLYFDKLLGSTKTLVMVACLKEDPDTILGYSVISKDLKILHWIYVKSAWRNQGLAKKLTPIEMESVSHITKLGLTLLKKFPNIIINPYIEL
jgi:ribosomal protein S18 acetylase RimI-like enzyme